MNRGDGKAGTRVFGSPAACLRERGCTGCRGCGELRPTLGTVAVGAWRRQYGEAETYEDGRTAMRDTGRAGERTGGITGCRLGGVCGPGVTSLRQAGCGASSWRVLKADASVQFSRGLGRPVSKVCRVFSDSRRGMVGSREGGIAGIRAHGTGAAGMVLRPEGEPRPRRARLHSTEAGRGSGKPGPRRRGIAGLQQRGATGSRDGRGSPQHLAGLRPRGMAGIRECGCTGNSSDGCAVKRGYGVPGRRGITGAGQREGGNAGYRDGSKTGYRYPGIAARRVRGLPVERVGGKSVKRDRGITG